jgi:hypothetical protein
MSGLRITCKDASRLISQMQDLPLPFYQRWLLRLHLLGCDACNKFVRQLVILRNAMRQYRR